MHPGGTSPLDANTPPEESSRHFLVPGKLCTINLFVFQEKKCAQESASSPFSGSSTSPLYNIRILLTISSTQLCFERTHYVLCSIYRNSFGDFSEPLVCHNTRMKSGYIFLKELKTFFFPFIFISWRLITLQYCSGFCHTLTRISMDLHVFPIPIPAPTSLPTRSLWVFPVHQPQALVSCIQPGLAICFTLDNIYVSMLFSQNIPPSPSPTESKSLFCTSVSLFLF